MKGLQVEYLTNPIGIDEKTPRLSWYSEANYRGMSQKSYRITMSTSLENLKNGKYDVWDSKTVNSDISTGIEYGGKALAAKTRVYWQVTVTDKKGKAATSDPAYFETGLMDKGFDGADWITSSVTAKPKSKDNPEQRPVNSTIGRPNDPAPMFRREFTASGKVRSARLYITAAGNYDVYINGKAVTESILNPGRSNYKTDLKYQTFDVSDLVKNGKNAIGAYLGHGWFNTKFNNFGTTFGLMAMLEITYTSGEVQTVVTDQNWKCYADGPIQYEDIMNGVSYDATKEQDGWAEAGFKDNGWEKVRVTTASALKVSAPVYTATSPITVESTYKPTKVIPVTENSFTYDFGVNIAGVPYVKVKGKAGQKIKFTYGEIINNTELATADGVPGSIYRKNLTDAQATDYYTLKGDPEGEVFYPNMTYHGFRYMQVEGVNFTISEGNFIKVEARAFCNEMERTGFFESSDKLVNQLFENSYRSNVGNFIAIPTDCPQRGERTGWSADAQVYSRTASFNLNSFAFLEEYAQNLTRGMTNFGTYPEATPTPNWDTTGPENGWGDAGVIIPWTMYLVYGDTEILKENYSGMKRFIRVLVKSSNENYERNDAAKYGDWMSVEKTPYTVTNNAYSAYTTGIVAKIARVLGYTDEAKEYEEIAEKFRQAFVRVCTDGNGLTLSDTQTSYVLGLAFDLFDEEDRKAAEDRLAQLITENGYKLKTGFLGVNLLNPTLSDSGYSDVAYKLLLQKQYPSWLYPVTLGATTTFEKWDGLKGDSPEHIKSTTGSLNHYAYGSISEWMYRYILGIDLDEKNPAYKHIILHPETNSALTYAKGSYRSQYGKIESAWKYENGNTVYEITIPANTTATLTLAKSANFEIKEGDVTADKAEGVTRLNNVGDDAVFEIVSGKYIFTVVGNSSIVEDPNLSDDPNGVTPDKDTSDKDTSDKDTSDKEKDPSKSKIPVGIPVAAGVAILAAAGAVTATVIKKKKK